MTSEVKPEENQEPEAPVSGTPEAETPEAEVPKPEVPEAGTPIAETPKPGDGDKELEQQRSYAFWIIVVLVVGFLVFSVLWIALTTEPEPWRPFSGIKNFKEYNYEWLRWLLAGSVGTFVYLMWEVAQYYVYLSKEKYLEPHLKGEKSRETEIAELRAKANFKGYIYWYLVNAVRGPLIVMVVMLLITNTSFAIGVNAAANDGSENANQSALSQEAENEAEVTSSENSDAENTNAELDNENNSQTEGSNESGTNVNESTEEGATNNDASSEAESGTSAGAALGISLDLSKADDRLLGIIAFMLGLFNRIPYHILEGAARRIFPEAFKKAYPEQTNTEDAKKLEETARKLLEAVKKVDPNKTNT